MTLMPYLLPYPPYPPGPAGRDSDLYRVKLVVHDLEAVTHKIIQTSHAKAQRAQSAARFARGSFRLREKTKA